MYIIKCSLYSGFISLPFAFFSSILSLSALKGATPKLYQYSGRGMTVPINIYDLCHQRWIERFTPLFKVLSLSHTMADQVRRVQIPATKNQCKIYEMMAEKNKIKALWGMTKWTAISNQWQKGTGDGTKVRG